MSYFGKQFWQSIFIIIMSWIVLFGGFTIVSSAIPLGYGEVVLAGYVIFGYNISDQLSKALI